MTLTFLGQRYESTYDNSTCEEVATVRSEVIGKYRGNPIKFSTSRVAAPAHVRLTYRGTSYVR
ncbi:MAG: DUF4278 domain-containing protein [Leptolyngbyaceae cyanobacterium bins.349]|nr:DUF4278 domain-containing protein [Leptolyngbyaceae cyanobacterium bins.349]